MSEIGQNPSGATVKQAGGAASMFSTLVIFGALVVGVLIYIFVFGASSNFIDNDSAKGPVAEGMGKWLGLIYKGGFIVPIAVGLLLMLFTFIIERAMTLARAKGSASMDVFVQKVQMHLEGNDVQSALDECDRQKGTVGNVVKEVLKKYREMQSDKNSDKETRVAAIQKALEESIALELPMLQKHLVIISTIVSIATLVGLIGTVLGMIRAFSVLATAGAPDPIGLANGISEALINTALGITTSTIATVAYNYFTANIDEITYRMDEAGYSIVQTYHAKY